MKYASGKFIKIGDEFAAREIVSIEIESREYEPQYRTIKTSSVIEIPDWISVYQHLKGHRYYLFPALQFNKNLLTLHNQEIFHAYSITTILDGKLSSIHLPHMDSGDICLGTATENGFYTRVSLTLDEFVDLFWFTSFECNYLKKMPDQISIFNIYKSRPSVWMDEAYNLSHNWKRVV